MSDSPSVSTKFYALEPQSVILDKDPSVNHSYRFDYLKEFSMLQNTIESWINHQNDVSALWHVPVVYKGMKDVSSFVIEIVIHSSFLLQV